MNEKPRRHMIGYARVSTSSQRLDLQIDALRKYGVEERLIFTDTLSGANTKRPGLKDALFAARDGGALVVWKLDRLGRTIRGILETLDMLQERGVELISLSEQLDTRTPMGKFVVHILAALAQMERDLTIERTIAGQEAAREKGIIGGRPAVVTPEVGAKIQALLDKKWTKPRIAKELKLSKATIYNWLKAERERDADPTDDR